MKLGLIYRKYLHGSDLERPVTVEILKVTEVEVQPHPTAPKQMKACLLVKGLPEHLPSAILFGPKGEQALVNIFGEVDTNTLVGKRLQLVPVDIRVNGRQAKSIGFQPAPQAAQPQRPAQMPAPTPPKSNGGEKLPF